MEYIDNLKAEFYILAFYDGETDKCFDEYKYMNFNNAYEDYKKYNSSTECIDYVKLFCYVRSIGCIELGME